MIINNRSVLREKGPLLLAANHPNSFLDSVIINTLFHQPVWSLARGDVFKKPFYIRLLRALRILPVYRTSEGVENLSENYKTFDECLSLFRQNGIITIFSEGKCINEWHLRPLKKGTARLAFRAWDEGIPLRVIPVSINYSSFRLFGKNIFFRMGQPIEARHLSGQDKEGLKHQAFNQLLEGELKKGVFEIGKEDRLKKEELLKVKIPLARKWLLFIPAVLGWLLHAALYLPLKKFVQGKTRNTDHYDSVLIALLMVSYPLYLLLVIVAAVCLAGGWGWLGILILPFTAWSFVQLHRQLDP